VLGRVLAPLAALVVLGAGGVALAGGPAPRDVALIVELEAGRAAVRDAARGAGVDMTVQHTFSRTLDALAVTVPEDQRDRLADLPGVAAVHPDRRVRASLAVSVPLVGAPQVWEQRDGSGRPVTGAGVDIAVIDTGVDGTHPALGGAVVGGHDYVNDDSDPMDDHGHGTHVAGIAAAGGEPTGVAPDASIVAYKVLDRFGRGDVSDAIAALEAAIDPANPHRAEVINLSLGVAEPADGPLTRAAQAAAESGAVVVAAAGNSGPANQTIEAPGQAPGVLAVGATISDVHVPAVRMVAPRSLDLRATRWEYSANPPQEERELELVYVGEGDFDDHDVRGKAVLIDAPGPPLEEALEAERRGAVALIINRGGAGPLHQFRTGSGDDGRFDSLVAVIIDDYANADLREALSAGPVRVALSGEDATDQIPAFSSRGPTNDFHVKPDLLAPGVEIRSTVPRALHAPGVARFSGTSMAAPHVAGAAALLRQLHPDWPAAALRSALAGTGEPVAENGGRLDVAAAADAAVVADATALSFGLAGARGRIDRTRTLRLTNIEDEPAVVRIAPDGPVRVTPSSFTLEPGAARTVSVRLDADSLADAGEIDGRLDVDVRGPAADLRVPWGASVRTLYVAAMPDPTDDRTEAFVSTPVELGAAPVVEVRGPDGIVTRHTAEHERDQWWRAVIDGRGEGVYSIRAFAPAADRLGGAQISGSSSFELAEPDEQNGSPLRWHPVGPNSTAGELDVGPGRDPDTYVMDTGNPVIWVSGDGAASWRARRIVPVPYGNPIELVADSRRAGTLYYAVNSGPGSDTFQGKVLRSDDNGRTWTALPAPDVQLTDLEIGRDVLAAATADGLYAGEDGGAQWEPVVGPWSAVNALQLADDDLYVATNEGIFVVADFTRGGRTPQAVEGASGIRFVDVAGNSRLLVASTAFRVYGSLDGGRTWAPLFTPPDGGSIQTLAVVGSTAYAVTFQGFWVGDRQGTRWQRRNLPLPGQGADAVVARPSGRGILVAHHNAGVFVSEDFGRTYRRSGVPGVPVWGLAIAETPAGRPRLVAGTRWDTYHTALPRQTQVETEWGLSGRESYVGVDARVAASPSRPRVVYKAVETALRWFNVLRSDDGGATWRQLTQGNEAATAVHVDPHDPDRAIVGYAALGGNGMLVTDDGGASWRRVRRDAPPAAITAEERDGDRLWIADATGLHRSLDGGETWATVLDEPVGAVTVSADDPRRVLAGGERLYVSEDGGASFRPAFYADLRLEVSDLLFDPHRPGTAYAATECPFTGGLPQSGRGVLRSTDGGRTWTSFSEGLDTRCVRTLELAPDGRHLFAGTATAGVQRIRLRNRP
jgi:minor extracellular serine protease Vpr